MGVPSTIALCTLPPSPICSSSSSSSHHINAHVSYDFDFNSSRSSSTPSSSASPSHKTILGGLSCLFSSPPTKHHATFSLAGDDLLPFRPDEFKDIVTLTSSFSYSPNFNNHINNKHVNTSFKRDFQSPVSVFHTSVSSSTCSNSITSNASYCVGSSRSGSSPMRVITGDSFRPSGTNTNTATAGLFNGFLRNALGSYVDYISPSLDMVKSESSNIDELPFNMEDHDSVVCGGGDIEPYAKELLLGAKLRQQIFSDEFVIRAFYEAEKAHRGQMRASGDPYLQHCVETGALLASIGANSTVVAAGLLHDTLDDSFLSYDDIARAFGPGVADLVEGVSKLSQLSKLARDNNTAFKTDEADRLHTMFLAMEDARAVLIKLADRLHNMMTLEALPLVKQQRFAKETLEVFVPLANRLGISTWKEQLENLCFKHLNPIQHKELSSKLLKSFDEAVITSAIEKLERALNDETMTYHDLSGRHKSVYSIYCKMLKKKLVMDQIHDIHGLRLIVDTEEDCYKALGIVRQLWPEVNGKYKDYISHPKFNGYQSLHTVVEGDGRFPFEVQIRTKQMHLQAEFGFAAHWRYKEDDCTHSSFVLQMVEWARWVVTWHCETMNKKQLSIGFIDPIKEFCKFPNHSDGCPFSYKPCCNQNAPVYVIMIENDKMSVQEFPANSTMGDVLERAGRGSSKGSPSFRFPMKEELRPRVNREPVGDPTCKLKMGDVVELTPAIPDKSLTEYREEIQRMYDRGLTVSSVAPIPPSSGVICWRG
ncbi:hypothetical protein ACFE04_003924 [Oxalis oulophora]